MEKDLKLGYVIVGESEGKIQYMATDHYSGGYPYWTNEFSNARIFRTIDEADRILNCSEFTKRTKMSDGSYDAPSMLRLLAKISNEKLKGKVSVSINEVRLDDVIKGKTFEVFDIKSEPFNDIEIDENEFKI